MIRINRKLQMVTTPVPSGFTDFVAKLIYIRGVRITDSNRLRPKLDLDQKTPYYINSEHLPQFFVLSLNLCN